MTISASQLPWLPLAKAAEKVSELTGKHHSEADIIDAVDQRGIMTPFR